jgi:hypothetical protein
MIKNVTYSSGDTSASAMLSQGMSRYQINYTWSINQPTNAYQLVKINTTSFKFFFIFGREEGVGGQHIFWEIKA